MAEYIPGRGNSKFLKIGGFLFCKYRTEKDKKKVYWRCRENSNGCKASATTNFDSDEILSEPCNEHNHEKQNEEIFRLKKVATLKEKVKTEHRQPVKRLFDEAFESEDPGEVPASCSFVGMKTTLYRSRRTLVPVLPTQLGNIVLEGEWTQTLDQKPFLLANDGEENKILVFSTDQNLEILSASDQIFMDGTFAVSPALFTQLYTIQVLFYGQMLPVLFALLPNKSQATYTRLFQIASRLCHERSMPFHPTIIQTDFEQAVLQACRIVFPQSSLRGCFFHFSQSIWRKV